MKFILLLLFCSQCRWALVSPLDQLTSLHLRNTKGDVTVLPSRGYAQQPGTLCVLLSFLSCLTSVNTADGSSKRLVTLKILLALTFGSVFTEFVLTMTVVSAGVCVLCDRHKSGASSSKHLFLSSLGSRGLKTRCQQGNVPSTDSERHCLPSSSFQVVLVLCLPPTSFDLAWYVCVCSSPIPL